MNSMPAQPAPKGHSRDLHAFDAATLSPSPSSPSPSPVAGPPGSHSGACCAEDMYCGTKGEMEEASSWPELGQGEGLLGEGGEARTA